MPAWIHDRAEHILGKNPSMPKSEAFAVASQQSHALGKSPKGYGTAEGRATAKKKYDTPKDDKKTANPGGLESPKMRKKAFDEAQLEAFVDELSKISGAFDNMLGGVAKATKDLPAARTLAAQVAPRVARQAEFIPAAVGLPMQAAKKLPLPAGALNPGGGFH